MIAVHDLPFQQTISSGHLRLPAELLARSIRFKYSIRLITWSLYSATMIIIKWIWSCIAKWFWIFTDYTQHSVDMGWTYMTTQAHWLVTCMRYVHDLLRGTRCCLLSGFELLVSPSFRRSCGFFVAWDYRGRSAQNQWTITTKVHSDVHDQPNMLIANLNWIENTSCWAFRWPLLQCKQTEKAIRSKAMDQAIARYAGCFLVSRTW